MKNITVLGRIQPILGEKNKNSGVKILNPGRISRNKSSSSTF
jgi:hypothetical protein